MPEQRSVEQRVPECQQNLMGAGMKSGSASPSITREGARATNHYRLTIAPAPIRFHCRICRRGVRTRLMKKVVAVISVTLR